MDVLDTTLEHGDSKVHQDMKDHSDEVEVHPEEGGHDDGITENLQYQFPSDGGSVSVGNVTYRVVQVTGSNSGGSESGSNVGVVPTSIHQASQPTALTQVIQTPYNSANSPESESQTGETRFTYFPAAAITPENNGTSSAQEGAAMQQTPSSGGQFYVMMSPQDVLQGVSQRTIAPRTHQFSPTRIDSARSARDDRRRQTHNEVERRRRDKINNWIVKLSKLVPDCSMDQSKQGQSKGGILMKTCDYIDDLKTDNSRMAERLKDAERMSVDMGMLRQQIEELKNQNTLLRAQLQQHGIEPVTTGQPS